MLATADTTASQLAPAEVAAELQLAALTGLYKASADPLRLQVLRVLKSDSFGVLELCSIFDIRQPALSHHLKVLAAAELVATRREGNSIFYRRSELGQPGQLQTLKQGIFSTVDQIELSAEIVANIANLQRQREANSRDFFRDNAHKFREQQDLIASYQQYGATAAQVLADAPLQQWGTALEVGPGDGEFLAQLSPRFERVVALDNSEQMLESAQNNAAAAGLTNITFIHGNTESDQLSGLQVDCVVINMVLHHTPSPAQVFSDISAILAPGGVVLVTDLCSHDQGWARANCGDVWLGFEPKSLEQWAHDSGLEEITSVYLAQRNGFQIQVRLFGHPQPTRENS
ncbi:MAG: metalloregulator ArsR/SmtB family transcription factor [Halieaceae bacterium]|jgi:ubiquinone/menaquinone biosynthesis C-methylase UbiE/DNA-binding transcriptional ArsR family regulator|nr:metalloregulator ArsR/SmtB family transcription factor [Halieaceae bacterium]